MDRNYKDTSDVMEVNWEQQRVLSNPLRSRMVALLYEKPMTPKQVADLVGKNPGTVYYHIQQLVKHEILEVDRVNTEKGIVEKYYKSKARVFKNPEKASPIGHVAGKAANIYLSKKLLDQLSKEVEDLIFKYGHLSYKEKDSEDQSPYSIEFLVKNSNEEGE
ncbi:MULTISPECIES: ArsR/SmtB family transcription factor [Bacillaceae]|uniref:Helix-turn-helix domain-containing protein n=1 Tax=Evansella alkalicola TaxID=745819 RepID=A0ABS6JYQ8_9BACI|nr:MULTISPECIES: helix-turn-helix domain-containing protein [Bacillaceae]MBU9722322.1 helix-turn-helix domain-containing protein [Bacillus alkalicola]